MALQFSITESPDGKSFIFKDLTDWDDISYDTTDITKMALKITFPDESEEEYVLDAAGYTDQEELEAAEFNLGVFPDGVYEFVLEIEESTGVTGPEDLESTPHFFGFAAIATQKVMGASLAFTPSEERKKREWILELQRLLNNLRYSAYTGNFNFFNDNLKQLQKIL